MEHDAVQTALAAIEAQLGTLKRLLETDDQSDSEDEESAEAVPPHENPRARRVRQREQASRVIRRTLDKHPDDEPMEKE